MNVLILGLDMNKHNALKKGLVCIAIALFIGISAMPSMGTVSFEKSPTINLGTTTFYVDDDFNETTPGWNVTHFAKISDAIKAATDGDTIFVYKGTYSVFTVNNNLTIIGESREETVVKANEIKLKSNGIKLTNFTLKGKTEGLDNVLVITGSYCDISYCTIVPTSNYSPLNGIDIGWCSYTTISNCDIIGFNFWALTCRSINNCYFENCTIGNSYRGVYTMGSGNKHVYVINCEIYNCGWDDFIDGAAVRMDSSSHNHVINCDIHDNAKAIDMGSSYNDIINCDIHDNAKGVDMWHTSHDNMIINNSFYYNEKIGLVIGSSCHDNYAYHNTFVSNSQGNAVDSGNNNIWDDDYPSGGNYWDDYTGEDNNGDGIGDTPYYIPGGINKDRYPLIDLNASIPPSKPEKPSGNTTGKNGVEYTYSSSSKDPNSDQIFYNFSWGEGNYSGWMGPYNSEEIVTASHAWTVSGKYKVKVIAKDEEGLLSTWSTSLSIDIGIPNPPTITGPTIGMPGVEYNYTFITTDPDGDDVWYYIDWRDESNSGWIGPYPSGQEVVVSHTWDKRGRYTIKAKAKDIFDAESEWGTLEVTMPVNQHSYSFPLLQRLLELFPNAFPILRYLIEAQY